MRARVLPLVLLALLVSGCTAEPADGSAALETAVVVDSGPAAAAEPAGSFAEFWPAFRAAVLADDAAAVAARTRFPFRTRGPMDGDPTIAHDAAAFPPLLARLLTQDPGLGGGAGDTMRRLIERTPTVDTSREPPDEVAVGDFVFERDAGGWRFARAFTSP